VRHVSPAVDEATAPPKVSIDYQKTVMAKTPVGKSLLAQRR